MCLLDKHHPPSSTLPVLFFVWNANLKHDWPHKSNSRRWDPYWFIEFHSTIPISTAPYPPHEYNWSRMRLKTLEHWLYQWSSGFFFTMKLVSIVSKEVTYQLRVHLSSEFETNFEMSHQRKLISINWLGVNKLDYAKHSLATTWQYRLQYVWLQQSRRNYYGSHCFFMTTRALLCLKLTYHDIVTPTLTLNIANPTNEGSQSEAE